MAHPSRRVKVNCSVCGKEKAIPLVCYQKNKTGSFLCGDGCRSIWMYKRVDTECANCHSPIIAYNYRYNRFKNIFCGAKCQGEFSRKGIIVNCTQCGKEIEARPSRLKSYEKQFCQRSCYAKWRSENIRGKNNPRYKRKVFVSCNYCGKLKRVYPCHAINNYYCDDVCMSKWRFKRYSGEGNPNWRGGYSPYAPGFNESLREDVRMRDNYTCQLCGTTNVELAVHHIDYDKENHAKENLVSLCTDSCHSRTNGNREFWTGYFSKLVSEREGATTIPKGSTVQANGTGSARRLLKRRDGDIVCSSRQREAVSLRKRSETCELR